MDSVFNMNEAESSSHGESRTTIISEMNPALLKAAIEGDIEPFKGISAPLHSIVTPYENTILHIYLKSAKQASTVSTDFVKQLLDLRPSLLLQGNVKRDTPLHIAAKRWLAEIVNLLIQYAKERHHSDPEKGVGAAREMPRMKNKEGNTALHEAARDAHNDQVVEVLTEEDPDFPYSANAAGETPLYIAVRNISFSSVRKILRTCTSVAYEGPNRDTALHAAVKASSLAADILTSDILGEKQNWTKETDQYGWTPLHYAAYYCRIECLKSLLDTDKSAAYIADKNRKMIPLHLAASQGHVNIMEEIINHCPDCCELVDDRGWNALHFALLSLRVKELIKIGSENKLLVKLVNERDVKGNTPLHLLAASRKDSFFAIKEKFHDISILQLYFSVNERNLDALEILRCGDPQLQQEILKLAVDVSGPYTRGVICRRGGLKAEVLAQIEQVKNSHLVVTALIATVTFAAAFTLPGGYESEEGSKSNQQGTAILIRNAAFCVFMITDAIAMTLSLAAVFVHFIMSLTKFRKYIFLFEYALWFTLFAMGAMVVAFVTGTYAVLAPSLWLAIVTSVIGLFFFLFILFMTIRMRSTDADRLSHDLNKTARNYLNIPA